MKTPIKTTFLFALFTCLLLLSCSREESIYDEPIKSVNAKGSKSTVGPELSVPALKTSLPNGVIFNDFPLDPRAVVEPSECGTTPFDDVIDASISSNLDALGAEWFDLYSQMNFLFTITDESTQFFGSQGQYTNLVKKITRSLEKFWDMPDEVAVRGQHNSTLDDKQKIIDILNFWFVVEPGEPEFLADLFVDFINPQSTFLIETPLLSFDGFAIALDGFLGQGDLIVIGDGLVELASEAGVQDKVVWYGIMAHEWAHQLQFNNFDDWYPDGPADNAPEATRTTELEADFFTGYYLTHKKGATYNWQRVEDFLELFFNIGDCSFESSGHHGTPLQRMEAAKQGFQLAKRAQKNGHILSQNEVHEVFLNKLPGIIGVGEADFFQ